MTRIDAHAQGGRRRKRAGLSCVLLACLALVAYPAGAQKTERAKALGARMMCMCGCNQVLTACNHVGCPISDPMLKELDERVARNEPDDLTVQAFVQEYGIAVIAQPASHGFGLMAWVLPFLVLGVGGWLIVIVVRRWRYLPVAAVPHVSPELLERARKESGDDE